MKIPRCCSPNGKTSAALDLFIPFADGVGKMGRRNLREYGGMRLTLTIDLDHPTAETIDSLLSTLNLKSRPNLRERVEPGERGQLLDVYGSRVGQWIVSDSRPCTVHGSVPLSHEQYKQVKLAFWCEVCQEVYLSNI